MNNVHLKSVRDARGEVTALVLLDPDTSQLHGLWLSKPTHSAKYSDVGPALL